jgi:hypothetical protein
MFLLVIYNQHLCTVSSEYRREYIYVIVVKVPIIWVWDNLDIVMIV